MQRIEPTRIGPGWDAPQVASSGTRRRARLGLPRAARTAAAKATRGFLPIRLGRE